MFGGLLSYIKSFLGETKEEKEEHYISSNNDGFLNTNMSILQGMYIRDVITEEFIMNNLFIKKLNMKIIPHVWCINGDYDIYSQSSEMQKKMENYIDEKITNLNNNEINLVYIRMPTHINGIYVDSRVQSDRSYYFYEPHIPSKYDKEYPLLQYIETSFEKRSMTKQNLPSYILKQQSLPLCYMYVLHLFVYLYMIDNELIEYKNIKCENDIEITDFTRFIIDQCFECNMIEPEDYYLLTNQICKYNLLPNKKYDCKFIFLRSSNPDVILSFFQNNDRLKIDFLQIKTLHNDINFSYIIDFIQRASNNNISEFNLHQIILLILTMKHCFGCNFSYNDDINRLFDEIQEDILVDAIKESDIMTIFYVYSFYIAILDLIKTNKNKKEVIDRIYYDSNKKSNCPNKLWKLIVRIHKIDDDDNDDDDNNIEYAGMRRSRDTIPDA